jgi:hypothetical protein
VATDYKCTITDYLLLTQKDSVIDICEDVAVELKPNTSIHINGVKIDISLEEMCWKIRYPPLVIKYNEIMTHMKSVAKKDMNSCVELNNVCVNAAGDFHEWSLTTYKITSNRSNTFVSTNVQKEFVDDLDYFLNNKKEYEDLGDPYTRNYLLHGVRGSGKSSIMFSYFAKIPVFNVTNQLMNNAESFRNAMNDAHCICEKRALSDPEYNGVYVVMIDELDKMNIITDKWRESSCLSIGGFLSFLSGSIPSPNRIVIMTANSIHKIMDIGAMDRPKRLHKIVEFGYSDKEQIRKIIMKRKPDWDYEKLAELGDGVVTPSAITNFHTYEETLAYVENKANKDNNEDIENEDSDDYSKDDNSDGRIVITHEEFKEKVKSIVECFKLTAEREMLSEPVSTAMSSKHLTEYVTKQTDALFKKFKYENETNYH